MGNNYSYSYRVYPKNRLVSKAELNNINQSQINNNLRTFGRYEYYFNRYENCYDIRFMNDGGDKDGQRFFDNIDLEKYYVWLIYHDFDGGGLDKLYNYNSPINSESALYKFDQINIIGDLNNPEEVYENLFDHWMWKHHKSQRIVEYLPNNIIKVYRMGYYNAYNGKKCQSSKLESPIEVGEDHFKENSYTSEVSNMMVDYQFKFIYKMKNIRKSSISEQIHEIRFLYKDRIVQQFIWHYNGYYTLMGRDWWDNLRSPSWVKFRTIYESKLKEYNLF